MLKTMNRDQPLMRNAPPVPNLEVIKTRWVIDYEAGVKRLVGSDGQIKDTQRLSASEIRAHKERGDMETAEKIRAHDHATTIEQMELSGKRFGRLTVKGYSGKLDSNHNRTLAVDCDCGNIGEFIKYEIVSGRRTSCGRDCKLRQVNASANGRKRKTRGRGDTGTRREISQTVAATRACVSPKPQTAIQPKAAITDLCSVASGIESILTLAALVPLEHVEALITEIDRQQQQAIPALFGPDDRLEKLADGRRAVEVFLEFRRQL